MTAEYKNILTSVSEKTGIDTKTADSLLVELATFIGRECCDRKRVAIPGFGAFEGVLHEEEIRTDLSSGKNMLYPPVIELQFTASSMLRKRTTRQSQTPEF